MHIRKILPSFLVYVYDVGKFLGTGSELQSLSLLLSSGFSVGHDTFLYSFILELFPDCPRRVFELAPALQDGASNSVPMRHTLANIVEKLVNALLFYMRLVVAPSTMSNASASAAVSLGFFW